MGIFRLLFELFLLYLAYKLVFEFIIPVYKTSKQVKQKMAEMQEKMRQQQEQQQQYGQTSSTTVHTESRPISGDYIDYEEVK